MMVQYLCDFIKIRISLVYLTHDLPSLEYTSKTLKPVLTATNKYLYKNTII